MVAVHGVDPGRHQPLQGFGRLRIPPERQYPFVVDLVDGIGGPFTGVEVERLDAGRSQADRPAAKAFWHLSDPGGVDQVDLLVEAPPCRQAGRLGVTQPQTTGAPARSGHVDDPGAGSGIFHVERQFVVTSAFGVQVVKGWDMRWQLVALQRTDRPAPGPSADHAVMIEDHDAVSGQPRVTLESAGTESKSTDEGGQGVFRRLGACTPVGETDDSPGAAIDAGIIHAAILAYRPRHHGESVVALKSRSRLPIKGAGIDRGVMAVTTVRANCPDCGDVEMMIDMIRLLCCASTGDCSYTFLCPTCRLRVATPAILRVVDALRSGGVNEERWELPAELTEVKYGPAITHDDLLSFHYLLQTEDWMRQVGVPGTGAH